MPVFFAVMENKNFAFMLFLGGFFFVLFLKRYFDAIFSAHYHLDSGNIPKKKSFHLFPLLYFRILAGQWTIYLFVLKYLICSPFFFCVQRDILFPDSFSVSQILGSVRFRNSSGFFCRARILLNVHLLSVLVKAILLIMGSQISYYYSIKH